MIRYDTKFEKVYHIRPDGLYQEYIRQYLVITDDSTNTVKKQFDREIVGQVFKRATVNDVGVNGFATFTDTSSGEVIQLIALQ
jgi:hypothetical protein